jgi:hypothetical protein
VLTDEVNLTHTNRTKELAGSADLEELLTFLWIEDRHQMKYKRQYIQLALYLQLACYTAQRPGSIVVSDAWRQSQDSIRYRVSQTYCPNTFKLILPLGYQVMPNS